ncbi:MAG: hypothetical protein HQL01_15020 [Nitrospirae bacterium]|nr:hypothetical protein [Nitrospirota bacterium]
MEKYVGIDVSKDTLDVCVIPGEESWKVKNDEEGIKADVPGEKLIKNI